MLWLNKGNDMKICGLCPLCLCFAKLDLENDYMKTFFTFFLGMCCYQTLIKIEALWNTWSIKYSKLLSPKNLSSTLLYFVSILQWNNGFKSMSNALVMQPTLFTLPKQRFWVDYTIKSRSCTQKNRN